VATLPPFHKRGICALSFNHASASDGGEALLASVGLDDDHTVAVWKDAGGAWSKPTRLAVGKGDNNPVTFAAWARVPAKKGDDDTYPLVTGGVRHIRFWKIEGTSLTAKKGVFGKVTPPAALLCATSHCVNGEWRLVTGASTGELLVWNGRECIQSRPAHEKALQCMVSVGGDKEDMARLITGGREGKVKVWNWSLESIMEYDVSSFRHVIEPSLRAIDALSRPTTQAAKQLNVARILVGTAGGEVFEIPTDQRQFDAALPPLAQSHFSEEAWGLDAPLSSVPALRDLVVTSGDDGTVRIWDTEQHAMVGRYLLPKRRAAASGATGAGAATGSPTRPAKGRTAAKPAAKVGAPVGSEEVSAEGATGRTAAAAERQMSRAVAWEPSLGQYILVGLGGDVGRSKNTRVGGHLVIHVARDKSGRWEVRDRYRQPFPMYVSRLECEWVSDVKWCPRSPSDVEEGDGRVFLRYATGSHDNLIRIFGVWSLPAAEESYSSMLLDPSEADKPAPPPQYLMRLQGHNSYVTHLDFSQWDKARQYLQSNCGGYELLFWDVTPTKQPLPTDEGAKAEEAGVSLAPRATPSTTRNTHWASWSCVLGWPVQGIWSGTMDGTDVNAVCRVDQTGDQWPRLAVAGDDGKLKVYKYPCVASNAEYAEGCAHSSHVTNVRFTAAREGRETRLFTTGGRDKCVMQWKLVSD
jgi:WD40 repeat protein